MNGNKPVVMIFAREISDPLTGLVKKVDEVNQDKGTKMGSFVVFLSDDEALEKKLKELARKEKLKKTALMLDPPAGPPDFNIAKDADITVVLYVGKKVKVNHAYKKGEFKTADIDKVVKELPKILDAGTE
jgi:hypothetical protein